MFLLALICISFGLPFPSNSSWILLWILLTVLIGAEDSHFEIFIVLSCNRTEELVRVAIYGAGEAGAQPPLPSTRWKSSYKVFSTMNPPYGIVL